MKIVKKNLLNNMKFKQLKLLQNSNCKLDWKNNDNLIWYGF